MPTRISTTSRRTERQLGLVQPNSMMQVDGLKCPLLSKSGQNVAVPRMSALCRYCCKILKSRSDNFPGRKQDRPCSPINIASGLLPKLPVSSSLCDEVPHIFIPISHLEPREFLISSAKRLLQQYRHIADNPVAPQKWVAIGCIADIGRRLRGIARSLMTH